MTDPIKRLNYFDHQFLHAADFADEQTYHLNMRRRHNRVLHTPGIGEGLDVSFNQGESKVSVQPGTAYDGNGREIIVLDKTEVDLQSMGNDATAYLTIKYAEQPSDTVNAAGVAGDTRMAETPVIEFAPAPPNNPTLSLILAVIGRKGKLIDSLDLTQRPIAGAKAGDLTATSLSLKIDGVGVGQWPKLSSSNLGGSKGLLTSLTNTSLQLDTGKDLILFDGGQVRSNDSGYRLSFNSAGKKLELQTPTGLDISFLTGSTERMRLTGSGNLGIGTNAPDLPLTIQGPSGAYMNFKGSNGAYILQVGADGNGGIVSTMTNHDLQLRAGQNNTALTIKASGNVGVGVPAPAAKLDVGDRVRIRQGASGNASLSFYQTTPAQDVASLLMTNDTQFGLWAVKTSKWGWVFDTTTGNVGVGTVPITSARLDVVGGDIRWGNSSRLTTDQGGSIELGGDNSTAGIGGPYIDFHFNGKTQDYNARLQNDADGRLTIASTTLQIQGSVGIGTDTPTNKLHVTDMTGIRQGYLYLSGASKGSSFGYNSYRSVNGFVFPDQTQTAVTLEMDSGSNGFKPRFEIYATSQSAPTAWGKKFGIDLTNGAISSPMMNTYQVMSFRNGPLPVTSNQFTTGGGTLLVFASGSAYLAGTGQFGAYVYIDYNVSNYFAGYLFRYTNEGGSHKTLIPSWWPVKIPAGTHTVTIVPWYNTLSDANDYFWITILELPF